MGSDSSECAGCQEDGCVPCGCDLIDGAHCECCQALIRADGSTVSGVAPSREAAGNPGFQVRTDDRGTDG